MNTTSWFLLSLAAAMLGAAWQAHRVGNERRDVTLLGVLAGLFGAGSLAVTVL